MRMSLLFSQTRREMPAETDVISHQLLIRSGFIRPLASGIFSYLPLAQRVFHKISSIMRAEMEHIGGQEICMPLVNPAELWQETGRWQSVGAEMGRFTDRSGHGLALAMTHEEVVSSLAREEIHSYKQLPALIYHIQTKWRDDPRPRAGLIRAREFTMLDSYSLDRDDEGLERHYQAHIQAYNRIFSRCGLPFIMVQSDSGLMGGEGSHEFMYLSPIGEDTIVICAECGYQANRQTARFHKPRPAAEKSLPKQKIQTPGVKTIEELAEFLNIPAARTAKAVFFSASFSESEKMGKRLVFAIIRGDMEINETKLQQAIQADDLLPADDDLLRSHGIVAGYASPVGLNLPLVLVDDLIPDCPNLAAGANEEGFHLLNVNFGRDYQANVIADIASAKEGDLCALCQSPLTLKRGVEIGNIFKLGTRYSRPMGCLFLDEIGQQRHIIMGSYGIGLGRLMACVAEEYHDKDGLCWPAALAPFDVHLVALSGKDAEPLERASALYAEMRAFGLEMLYDDRPESPGVKFKDADLIGIPLRLTVSRKSLNKGIIEVKFRRQGKVEEIPLSGITDYLRQYQQKIQSEVNL